MLTFRVKGEILKMEDVTSRGKRIKKEFIILMICLLLAFGINIYFIIIHQTRWVELWTYLPTVILLGIMIYLLLAAVRSLIYIVRMVFIKK